MSKPIIQIEHVSAEYDGKQVLKDINLTVYQDDYLGIIGPNGGGKTTLMRLILGLKKPTEGSIHFCSEGKEISMGYLPQYNDLDKQFPISVYEVVLSGLSKSKSLFARYTKQHHQQVAETLERMQISDLKDRHIGALSGGQLQRVLLHVPSFPSQMSLFSMSRIPTSTADFKADVRNAGTDQQGMRHHHRKSRHS